MPRKVWYSENADVYPGIIARNNAVVEYEKFIHRTFYPYIFHPYSSFRIAWEKAYIVFIPIRLTIVYLAWAILSHESYSYQATLLIFQVGNLLDIILKFFTGYVDFNTDSAILDPKKIAKMYLMTFFVPDFIPCIPFQLCLINADLSSLSPGIIAADIAALSVILRLFSFFKYCRNLTKLMMWNYFLLGSICVAFTLYVTILFATDVYMIIFVRGKIKYLFISDRYVNSTSEIVANLLEYMKDLMAVTLDFLFFDVQVSVSNIFIRTFILDVTFFSSIIFMAYFIKCVMFKMKMKDKFLDLESRVVSFLRKKHLPTDLGYKTLLYFQILLDIKYFKEDEIFNYIPDTFKAEIFYHMCLPLLKKFYAFEHLPTYVMRRLAECMKYQLFLPNELIMKKDVPNLSMYFVQRGTVALYSHKHVELYHFEAGSCFNWKNLIMGEPLSKTYAISIEVTEVYRIDQEDFFDIMRTYPKVLKFVQDKLQDDNITE